MATGVPGRNALALLVEDLTVIFVTDTTSVLVVLQTSRSGRKKKPVLVIPLETRLPPL
jgi:hypothetical protein